MINQSLGLEACTIIHCLRRWLHRKSITAGSISQVCKHIEDDADVVFNVFLMMMMTIMLMMTQLVGFGAVEVSKSENSYDLPGAMRDTLGPWIRSLMLEMAALLLPLPLLLPLYSCSAQLVTVKFEICIKYKSKLFWPLSNSLPRTHHQTLVPPTPPRQHRTATSMADFPKTLLSIRYNGKIFLIDAYHMVSSVKCIYLLTAANTSQGWNIRNLRKVSSCFHLESYSGWVAFSFFNLWLRSCKWKWVYSPNFRLKGIAYKNM